MEKVLTVDEVKQIELTILKEVADFCDSNGIKYFLLGGTLLGAIRHEGFIPWDDDIDIGMMREDYNKFCRLFSSPNLSLHKPGDKRYSYSFAKVSKKGTVLREFETRYQDTFGIYIDVFPLNDIPDDSVKYFKKLRLYKILLSIKSTRLFKKRSFTKFIVLLFSKVLFSLVPVECIVKKIDKYTGSFANCNYVGNTSWGYGEREKTRKEVFSNSITVPFEEFAFTVPSAYDEWLRNIFGDYLKLPPVEKRVSEHNFEAKIL